MKTIVRMMAMSVALLGAAPAQAWVGVRVGHHGFAPAPHYYAPPLYYGVQQGHFAPPLRVVRYRPLRQAYYAPQPFIQAAPALCPPRYGYGRGRGFARGPVAQGFGYGVGW